MDLVYPVAYVSIRGYSCNVEKFSSRSHPWPQPWQPCHHVPGLAQARRMQREITIRVIVII